MKQPLAYFGILAALAATGALADDEPYTVEKALRAFELHPALRIELVAADPDVDDPVDMAFDPAGRLYVVEMRGYPTGPGEGKPPAGRIALLVDDDNDGRYTRLSTFADNLPFPTGVLHHDGGIFVTCAPDILFLKDTNGDNKADVRRVVFTGFAARNTQLRVNHPTFGLDNWIHVANGLRGGTVRLPEAPDAKPVAIPRMNFKFTPDGSHYEATPGFAQFGLCYNDRGDWFGCSNRNHIKHVVLQPETLKRNAYLAFTQTEDDIPDHGPAARIYAISQAKTTALSHHGTFTAACGIEIYRGHLLPAEFRGNAFVCDPTANLVHRDVLVPAGGSYVAGRAREKIEFLASPDSWFRPVNVKNGPDGALYVLDMVRKVIEHPDFLPEAVRKVTDFESGKGMGRIWRIAPKGVAHKMPELPAGLDTAQLVDMLGHPNGWHRTTAQQLLYQRNDPGAGPLLREVVTSAESANARIHALHLLRSGDRITAGLLQSLLDHPDLAVRGQAIAFAQPFLAKSAGLTDGLLAAARDADARVRFETALALGAVDDDRIVAALGAIAGRDVHLKWTRVAVLSALPKRSDQLLSFILDRPKTWNEKTVLPTADFLSRLASLATARMGDPATRKTLDRLLVPSSESLSDPLRIATVTGLADGLQRRPKNRTTLSRLLGDDPDAFRPLVSTAAKLATDAKQPADLRVIGVELLAHAPYDWAGPTLVELMIPSEPETVQLAAASAIGKIADDRVGPLLTERQRWRAFSPAIRGEVLARLLATPQRVGCLLDAVAEGDIQGWAVEPARRNQLLKHKNEAIKKRAREVFGNLPGQDRRKVYEEYLSILKLPADPNNGKEVFLTHCGPCHRIEDVGVNVGVDVGAELLGMRNQSKETLLLHVIMPNHTVAPQYTNYLIETVDGQTITGLIASETPTSVTLRRAQGAQDTILRSNIKMMYSTSLSLMPEELEKNMTRQELADAIDFLKNGSLPESATSSSRASR